MTKTEIEKHAPEVSRTLKLLAHPIRLKLLCALSMGEKTVTELVQYVEASQSWVSQFLTRMRLEGLVDVRRDSKFAYYRIRDVRILSIMEVIQTQYCKPTRRKNHD